MNKILVTGSYGLLGSTLVKTLIEKRKYEVYGLSINDSINIKGLNFTKIDLRESNSVKKVLSDIMPDVIIHCAALIDVDYCESNKGKCYNVNVNVTKYLVDFSRKNNAKFIYISTDSVYGGKEEESKEKDILNPVNYYVKTKILSEEAVRKLSDYIILRTNIYCINFQERKVGLVEWFINKLRKEEQITGFKDIVFNPILINNLSEIIIEMIEKNIKGIFNVGGSECLNKYDFGKKIAKVFNLDSNLIKLGTSNDMKFIAKRPKNTTMNIDKVKGLIDTKILNIEDGLKEMKRLIERGWFK